MGSFCVYLRMEVDHFLKAVDEITVKDIASIAQKLLSSPLTMASYGDGILPFSFSFFIIMFCRFLRLIENDHPCLIFSTFF